MAVEGVSGELQLAADLLEGCRLGTAQQGDRFGRQQHLTEEERHSGTDQGVDQASDPRLVLPDRHREDRAHSRLRDDQTLGAERQSDQHRRKRGQGERPVTAADA